MPDIPRKPDSSEIVSFLQELEKEDWVHRTERHWWPRYVFHYSRIENIVQILQMGELLSRAKLAERNIQFGDSAETEIIAQTREDVINSVRLYFRPCTPTQYRMEGIRPRSQLWHNRAHCPVPVFLLFDSKDILTRADSIFTGGNLATRHPPEQGATAAFLRNLPFQQIYHTGIYDPQQQASITFHRNAEIIVPERLDLSGLRVLVCRTPAEKDTFLSLLPSKLRTTYQNRIRVANRIKLYEKKWSFVDNVVLTSERIVINFNPDSATPGPFLASFCLENLDTGKKAEQEISDFYTNGPESKPNWNPLLTSGASLV
jgi:hypothetical protein